jgi:hypothetical protein
MESDESSEDPYDRAAAFERRLRELCRGLDDELGRVGDERARLLFDTARQVLGALITAFEDYQQTSGLWRDGAAHPFV